MITREQLDQLASLKEATKPQPEQDTRVGEALAGQVDDRNRRAYQEAVWRMLPDLLETAEAYLSEK